MFRRKADFTHKLQIRTLSETDLLYTQTPPQVLASGNISFVLSEDNAGMDTGRRRQDTSWLQSSQALYQTSDRLCSGAGRGKAANVQVDCIGLI